MGSVQDNILKLSQTDEKSINKWVFDLFAIGYDGIFGGILESQYEDPSVAFKVVYEDARHCELSPEDLDAFRIKLRLSLLPAIDDYYNRNKTNLDPFVLGELISSIKQHEVIEAITTLSKLSQLEEMVTLKYYNQPIQDLLSDSIDSLNQQKN